MATVKYLEGPSAGMTLNVADPTPYTQSGKYGLVQDAPTSGASLSGTMVTPQKAPLPSVPTPQTDSRSLPTTPTGSLANFKNAIQNISRIAYDQGPSSTDILKGYSAAGMPLTTPQAIGGAISMNTQSRAGAIGDVYRQTIDMIKEQEQTRREKEAKDAQWAQQLISIMPKSVFGALSPQEFGEIRSGNPSATLIQKIQTAIATESASEKPTPIGQDELGNTQYGTFDTTSKSWKPISVSQPAPTGPVSNKSKVISAGGKTFDFSTYATDPNWGNAVNNKLSQIGKFNSLDDVSTYIKKRAPNSPVTAQMVAATSQKYGLPWELIVALADHESGLGTLGAGARTFNPGNVGNVDSGATKNMGDWQTGLDAMGAQIARRAIAPEKPQKQGEYDTSKFTPEFYNSKKGQQALNNEQQYHTSFLSQPVVKDFVVIQSKANSIDRIINSGSSGPADLALVFEFMKALDPNSVVRETEYETAAKSGNIFKGVFAKFNGYLKEEGGFLPDNVKQQFLALTKQKMLTSKENYDQMRNQFRKTAFEQGLNPDHVAPELTIKNIQQQTQATSADTAYLKSLGLIK